MNRAQMFLRKNSSNILSVVAATGVVATTVLSVKATPKALILINNKKKELNVDKLTPIETVKAAWKPYIPAAISGFGTLCCIFGINYLSIRNQASLMSAYALLDQTYKEYQNKVKDLYGDEANINVKHEIAKTKYNPFTRQHEELLLFFDFNSMQYFEATMDEVMRAECKFLEGFHYRGYACIKEYYDILKIPQPEWGYQ